MSKARDIADLGSNDVLDTSSSGIDVTGSVTADGLTVDGGASHSVVAINNGVYSMTINQNTGGASFLDVSGNNYLEIDTNSTRRARFEGDGDFVLYEDTGATPKFFWDASAESLGIGTDSPNKTLTVAMPQVANTAMEVLRLTGSGIYSSGGSNEAGAGLSFGQYSGTYPDWNLGQISGVRSGAGWAGALTFSTNDGIVETDITERMRIDSSGRVGIGTSSPSTRLHTDVTGGDNELRIATTTSGDPKLTLYANGAGAHEIAFDRSDLALTFTTVGSSERMRIDSSGNVLVGGTNTYPADNNVTGHSLTSVGQLQSSVSGYAPLIGNRKASDGDIAVFKKDGSTVGSIGYFNSPEFVIGRANNGVGFSSSVNALYPTNPSSGSIRGDTMDLGFSTGRWKDLYLSGGVYLGGTGSANYLDDYEVGDWSSTSITTGPDVTTGGTMDGRYRKVGNIVHIFGIVSGVTASTGRRYIVLSGLPFVQVAGYPDAMGICSNYPNGDLHGHAGIVIDNTSSNNNQWFIEWYNDSAQSNRSLTFSLTYETS
jgi:hypothetical protein